MSQKQKRILSHFSILSLFLLLIVFGECTSNTSTKGRVIQMDPVAIEYLSNSYDHVLVFFLQERNDELEEMFQAVVKEINQSYPEDNTFFGVTYFVNDTTHKLHKFNNKSQGFRLITKRNFYQLAFETLEEFGLLKKFYSRHAHPVLPLFLQQQYKDVQTQNFLVFQFNSRQILNEYVRVYRKIYDYLKLFNVRAIATQSQTNSTKISLYNKKKLSQPVAVFMNEYNNTDQLIDFVNVETLPLVTQLNDQDYVRVFGSFLDTQFLLIYDQKNKNHQEVNKVRQELKAVAQYNKNEELKYQRILFAQASTQFLDNYFDEVMKQLKNQNGDDLIFKLVLTKTDYGLFQLRRFNYVQKKNGQIKKENLINFIEDVRMKKIDAQYKSESIPTQEEQANSVLRKIVGNSFIKQIYEKPDQSIIVLFIDTKDQKSYQEIQQVYQQFTTKYKNALQGKVISAVFDLGKNQHKLLTIRTAPQLVLFQKSNKKKPIFFRGYAKVQSIKDWINYSVKDISIPQNYGEAPLPLSGGVQETKQPQTIESLQLGTKDNPIPMPQEGLSSKQNIENTQL